MKHTSADADTEWHPALAVPNVRSNSGSFVSVVGPDYRQLDPFGAGKTGCKLVFARSIERTPGPA